MSSNLILNLNVYILIKSYFKEREFSKGNCQTRKKMRNLNLKQSAAIFHLARKIKFLKFTFDTQTLE